MHRNLARSQSQTPTSLPVVSTGVKREPPVDPKPKLFTPEFDAIAPKYTFEQKTEQEIRYRHSLLDDLLNQRTHFASGPYEAHIQYSNFCNMSCIMCWDGRNPPTKKTSAELIKLVDDQIAPHLSVITPYSGSEPLVLSWDETRHTATTTSTLLCITTNCQYLDEARFDELKDITETLLLSIDSHIPEIFGIIRPGGNVEKVFKNLESTARLSKQHGVECIVNIVLMTYNAPHLDQTIEYLGDLGIESVNIIQMLDVNGRSRHFDALLHFSQEYVDWIKKRCVEMTEKKKMRLIWSVAGCTHYDFRPTTRVQPMARKSWNDAWDRRMRRMFPGFCKMAMNRLRVDGEGDVAPCCYAIQGELSLGNLNEKPFEEIWNGNESQDLRRGMLCGDVPAHCSSCRYIDPIGPQQGLSFFDTVDQQLRVEFRNVDAAVLKSADGSEANDKEVELPIATSLKILGPNHAERLETAPELLIADPLQEISEFRLVLSLAGESDELHSMTIQPTAREGNILRFAVTDDVWQKLRTNVGYWWNIWAIPTDASMPILRSKKSPCFIRHLNLVRIEGSKLKYKDRGALPVIDLGVQKQLGWDKSTSAPDRPETEVKRAVVASAADKTSDLSIANQGKRESASSPSIETKQMATPPPLWKRIAKAVKRPKPTSQQPAEPVVPKGNQNVLDGYIDQVAEYPDYLHVVGWKLLQTGPADVIEFESKDGQATKASVISRPDLAFAFPNLTGASDGGFEAKLRAKKFKTEYGYEFTIVAKCDGVELSRVHVSRFITDSTEEPNAGPFWFGKSDRLTIG